MQNNLKEMLKEQVRKYPSLNAENMKKKMEGYSYISFDIFDTLLKRTVAKPSDVFYLVSKEYERRTGNVIDDFQTMRIMAEHQTKALLFKERLNSEKNLNPNSKVSEEITLTDIYRQMKGLTEQEKEIVLQIECDLELQLCCENKEVKRLFNWCLKQNKKIIVISDIYLPEELIEQMLCKCGYTTYQKLYISSSTGLRKKTGSLFSHIRKDLNISERELLHIGDSLQSDYLAARKLGIKAILLPNKINHLRRPNMKTIPAKDKLTYPMLQAMMNCTMPEEKEDYYKFGYESFGILLFHFSKWLKKDVTEKKINKIFFFSRDGQIIKTAFDTMYSECGFEEHYIYVSRRSLRVPQLWFNSELEAVVYGFPAAKFLTVETFIINLGLEPSMYTEQLKQYALTLSLVLKRSEILTNDSLHAFYNTIRQDVVENSKREYEDLLQYLEVNQFHGDVAVVDIGWRGSLQYFLQQIVDKARLPVKMHGYYISLSQEAKWQLDIKGYVCDDTAEKSCTVWKPFVGFAETLFMAREGSAKKYAYTHESRAVEPVLYPYEYENQGALLPEALHITAIQEGALSYIRNLLHYPALAELDISSLSAFLSVIAVGNTPTRKELKMFANIQFLDEKVSYLAKPEKLTTYLTAPNKLKQDLWGSRWKIGFLKRLLHIPLDYVKLYKVLSGLES